VNTYNLKRQKQERSYASRSYSYLDDRTVDRKEERLSANQKNVLVKINKSRLSNSTSQQAVVFVVRTPRNERMTRESE